MHDNPTEHSSLTVIDDPSEQKTSPHTLLPKPTVLSGMRPTGRLHIGHVESVLKNWKELQERHRCYYFVADWHALTTEPDTKDIEMNTIDMVRDWLAYGINPDKSTIFVQSAVPEHAELHLILSMLTNIGRLERVPSFKAQLIHLAQGNDVKVEGLRGSISFGFMGYPVLQSADILLYKTDLVPVGEDQVPHIELTREIARDFNATYGQVFTIPKPMLAAVPRILGTDGRKMSKSYKNTISPEDDEQSIDGKVRLMVTDPARKTRDIPGNPEVCSVYDLHLLYREGESLDINRQCRTAQIGCGQCKSLIAGPVAKTYQEFRERRNQFNNNDVKDILWEGNKQARQAAQQTMKEVRHHLLLDYLG
jgi:tryptophanyl-tRNA synthetase